MRRALSSCSSGRRRSACPPSSLTPRPRGSQLHAPSDPYAGLIAEAAQRFGIPAAWIRAIMRSREPRRSARRSRPRARSGLMQLMPETWAALRARYGLGRDPFDAHDNILAGAAFLREMHDRYGSPGFLAAYNAGPGRYEDYRDRHRPLPAETVAYVAALVPFVGDGAIDGPVLVAASDPPSWTQAPLFITRSASAEPARSRVGQAAAERHAGCRRGARSVGHRTAIRRAVRPRFRSGAEAMIALLPRRSCRAHRLGPHALSLAARRAASR